MYMYNRHFNGTIGFLSFLDLLFIGTVLFHIWYSCRPVLGAPVLRMRGAVASNAI